MTKQNTADVIVVGLGAVGSSVAHHLARGGARVIGIDRFYPPHNQGSSHGLTRITRLAIGESEACVPLALRSHVLWRELEAKTGQTLFRQTGGLVIASTASDAVAFHGRAGFLSNTVAAARRFSIAHELLDATEVRRRFPQFLLRDDEQAYFEADAGVLFPEECVRAQLLAAAWAGAVFRLGEQVLKIDSTDAGISVVTSGGRLTAARLVLTAGAWLPGLAGGPFARQLRVRRQVLQWFRTDAPSLYQPERSPIFIWMHGQDSGDSIYGFPMGDCVDGVKVASEQYETTTDPDAVDREVTDAEVRVTFDRHVRGRLAHLREQTARTATCLYTSTADGNFMVGPHPQLPAVTVVSACSGHGFKHSAGLGEAVAQQVLGGATQIDLSPFAVPYGPSLSASW